MKTVTFEDWEREQRRRDPGYDMWVREWVKIRGPKRKVPLLLDENLESDFIAGIRSVKDFRVSVSTPHTTDTALWKYARSSGSILMTSDLDFWNDGRFPLAQCPGLVIVRGRTADDKVWAAARAFGHWGIIENWRKVPGWLAGTKIRASRQGVQAKWWSGTAKVTLN